jgi:hypothetical protein
VQKIFASCSRGVQPHGTRANNRVIFISPTDGRLSR